MVVERKYSGPRTLAWDTFSGCRGGIGESRGSEQLRVLVELGLEDRLDALAGGRADRQRPAAGGLQPGLAIVAGEVEQPQAGAVALLGMRAVLQLPAHHARGYPGQWTAPS